LVFYHRHGSWHDFGQFLKAIFHDSPHIGRVDSPARAAVVCRHTPGGVHHAALTATHMSAADASLFALDQYRRPCFSIGSYDERKNPGLIVADLCKKAKEFLLSIGKGDPKDATGRDFEFEPTLDSDPVVAGSSEAADSQGDIDMSNVIGTKRRRSPEPDEEFDDEMFADEDALVELDQIVAEVDRPASRATDGTMETPSGFLGSDDSVLQLEGRTTTKMRAATLGYLWHFADDPSRLRDEFRRLRNNDDLHVLHLCGDGICYKRGGVRIHGCVEHSHLRLGTAVENRAHTAFHGTISLARSDQYADVLRMIHQLQYGQGVF
jgi:hypothetical protein